MCDEADKYYMTSQIMEVDWEVIVVVQEMRFVI